jgi:glycolate oxidase iron-sulfur subunit
MAELRDTPVGREANDILRSCVHCGFCTATCPTYQLRGDELDGPRGRIYQVKELLEGQTPTVITLGHLDRCLSCRSCETTCPSGVRYARLIDIGRDFLEPKLRRPIGQRLMRRSLRFVLPRRRLFAALLRVGQGLRPLLPDSLRSQIPARVDTGPIPKDKTHPRQVILPGGCVQGALTPLTLAATRRVFDKIGITAIVPEHDGCCGAVSQHLAAADEARRAMRRNIDVWWPSIEAGAEAIVITASGCGAMIKEYGYHLKDDPAYATKAERVASLAKDLCEVVTADDLRPLAPPDPAPIAFQSPCTLQHGQQLNGRVEELLAAVGFPLVKVSDPHLCCGSAGTYSILQPELSTRLRERKLAALQEQQPSLIATANVGCQTHLQTHSEVPVVHWIELFDPKKPHSSY